MKPTIIIALAGFSALTSAALYKKRGNSECGLGSFGGIVGEIPNPELFGYGTSSSSTIDPSSTTTTTTTTTYTAVQTITVVGPAPTPYPVVRRGEYFLDSIHAKQNGLLSQQEEIDSMVEMLNHAFGHGALEVGKECGLVGERGCVGNKVVECRAMVWEEVEDCGTAGLGMECKAVSEENTPGGGWKVGIGCLQGGMEG